jgi:chloride channel 7
MKRQLIAAGASCGVSVAFGSPIGGALFSYEISKPNTFWTFSMLWRVFSSTAISCFTLSILQSLYTHSPLSLSDSGALKFGSVSDTTENTMMDLPGALIIGTVAGVMGAIFIHITISLSIVRKKYVSRPWSKILECVLFAFFTSTSFFLVVSLRQSNCFKVDQTSFDLSEEVQFTCPDGYYNPLATLIFNTEGGTLRQFFRYPNLIDSTVD